MVWSGFREKIIDSFLLDTNDFKLFDVVARLRVEDIILQKYNPLTCYFFSAFIISILSVLITINLTLLVPYSIRPPREIQHNNVQYDS